MTKIQNYPPLFSPIKYKKGPKHHKKDPKNYKKDPKMTIRPLLSFFRGKTVGPFWHHFGGLFLFLLWDFCIFRAKIVGGFLYFFRGFLF